MSEWCDLGCWIILMGLATVIGDLWLRVYRIQNELRKWRQEWQNSQKQSDNLSGLSEG